MEFKKFKSMFLIFFIMLFTVLGSALVFAVHTHTATISPEFVKGSQDDIGFTINVLNNGDDNISRVEITKPASFSNLTCGSAPTGWDSATHDASNCKYSTSDSPITSGNSLNFTLTLDTPGTEGSNNFTIVSWQFAGGSGSFDNSTVSVTVDDTAPTYVISYDNPGPVKAGDIITITATFNEPVQDIDVNISLTQDGGNAEELSSTIMTRSDSTTYTYEWIVGTGNGNLKPEVTGAKDLAGNAVTNTDSTQTSIEVDNTAPFIGVANIVGTTISGSDDTIKITFSEPVVAADGPWSNNEFTSIVGSVTSTIDLTNASFSYDTVTLTITLDRATDNMFLTNGETLTVTPATDAIKDLAGNVVANTAVVGTTEVTGDVTAPTVALTYAPDQTRYKEGAVVTITATFSEEVYGEGTGDVPQISIAVPGSGIVTDANMTIVGGDEKEWTYDWTVGDGDGDATVTIIAKDFAGNANVPAENNTKTVDNVKPTLDSIILESYAFNIVDNSTTVTFTFSEAVTGFDADDIIAPNGEISDLNVVTGNPLVYTATFTADIDIEESTNVISVGTGWTDLAGNSPEDGNVSENYTIDTKAPVIGEITPVNSITNNNTPNYTFTTDEAGDISYGGGCTSETTEAVLGSNTITLSTLADDLYDACTIVVTDAAGNESNTLTMTEFRIDTTKPVLSTWTKTAVAGEVTIVVDTVLDAAFDTTYENNVLTFNINGNNEISNLDFSDSNSTYLNMKLTKELTAGEYSIAVKVKDLAGNEMDTTFYYTLTVTEEQDTTPPVIDLTVTAGINNNLDFNFTSDEVGTYQIYYGITDNYGYITGWKELIAGENTITIENLTCETEYFYKLIAKDTSGNETSVTESETTSACPASPEYAFSFPQSGTFINLRYAYPNNGFFKEDFLNMAIYDVNLTLEYFLNSSGGPEEEKLKAEDVEYVYIYTAQDGWMTIISSSEDPDDYVFENFNLYTLIDGTPSNSSQIFMRFQFTSGNVAEGKAIRHLIEIVG